MEMYKCRTCGEVFNEPRVIVERHGFTDGMYEKISECPECGSGDYDYATIVDKEDK